MSKLIKTETICGNQKFIEHINSQNVNKVAEGEKYWYIVMNNGDEFKVFPSEGKEFIKEFNKIEK